MKKLALIFALAMSSTAMAHPGSRVWVGNENDQLITYQKSGNDYVYEQVYLEPLDNIVDNIWTTDFPGYEVRPNGDVASGTEIGFDFTGPLLRFTGTGIGFTELIGNTDTKLAITNEIDETVFSKTGNAPGTSFFFPSLPGDHAHMFYTPCGDGVNAGGALDGVYIQPMRLSSPTLESSNWYFLVLSQNGSTSDQTNAVALSRTMANALPGDTNFDGIVNFADLLTVAQNYGTSSGSWWTRGDFDFDGAVNFSDLLLTAQNYSSASGTDFETDWLHARATVPEPGMIGLLGIVVVIVGRRTR
ncbi:MAG TPA: hypothetical protein PK402_01590 [Tepidisphaeraceae bacterium]|nr:hypothetical protein [Tepidisphaeraceae bacterium]